MGDRYTSKYMGGRKRSVGTTTKAKASEMRGRIFTEMAL